MHIYISGVGGSGLSSMAHLCLDLGFKVSGSDITESETTFNLIARGLNFNTNQIPKTLSQIHQILSIDYYLHSPAINQQNPEYRKAVELNLQFVTQNQLINKILEEKKLRLLAVSGTHGKTTTTAMIVWLLQQLNIPVSYIIGTKISFGNSGKYDEKSQYLIFEADEFNRKFLELKPELSVVTTLDYDHPDTYPTRNDYYQAFLKFFSKSNTVVINNKIAKLLCENDDLKISKFINVDTETRIFKPKSTLKNLNLPGLHNRENACLAVFAVKFLITNQKLLKLVNNDLIEIMNQFPGTKRRFEKIGFNLYSDYAHHPVEIRATLQLAKEATENKSQKLIVVYQPHQNSRQIELINSYVDCFNEADKIYWLPTFLARENPDLPILKPHQIIENTEYKSKTFVQDLNNELKEKIKTHLESGDLVLILGAGNIDQWFRDNFSE